jgi:hypothetical protein
VSLSEAIELHAGGSPGLNACQQAVSVLALVALIWSRAELMWIMMSLLALGAAHRASDRVTRRKADHFRLVLHENGNATMHSVHGTAPARLCAGGWVTRWCSVVSLEELLSGRRLHCLICRSRNSSDDYRRLLVILRMDAAHTPHRGVTWL